MNFDFGAAINAILEFFKPVTVFFMSVGSLVAFLLGALQNPQGLMNQVVCTVIDVVTAVLPSTPQGLHISDFVSAAANQIPAVGRGIISEVLTTIASLSAIALAIKIYKLIPFKAT